MTDVQLEEYTRRIETERDRFHENLYALEAQCAQRIAGHAARAARTIRTSGRYWALGHVLAAMVGQSFEARETRALDADIDRLVAQYTETSLRIEQEVLRDY